MTVLYDQRAWLRGRSKVSSLLFFSSNYWKKFAGRRGDGSAEGGQVTQGSSAVERKHA